MSLRCTSPRPRSSPDRAAGGLILLASRSPQRRALLGALGVDYRVVASTYGEDAADGLEPAALAETHARAKARDVAARSGVPEQGAVLAADTIVVVDGAVLGKPVDRDDARAMLKTLSGRRHSVLTAVCVIAAAGEAAFVDEAAVTFLPLSNAQVDWYLDRGEWQGRAGGYAIQGSGSSLVARVEGDFTTVVGLPVGRLTELLDELGLAPWSSSGAPT